MNNLKLSNESILVMPDPSGYQLVEYIDSSSGNHNVDTGVIAANKEFILDIEFTNNTDRELMGISGSSSEYFGHNKNVWEKVGNSKNVAVKSRVILHYDVGNITSNKTNCWIEGSTNKAAGTSTNFAGNAAKSFKLFSLAGSGYNCHMKFYGLTVKNSSGAIINQFYPAKRLSDGAFGIYDIITRTFKAATSGMTSHGTRQVVLKL